MKKKIVLIISAMTFMSLTACGSNKYSEAAMDYVSVFNVKLENYNNAETLVDKEPIKAEIMKQVETVYSDYNDGTISSELVDEVYTVLDGYEEFSQIVDENKQKISLEIEIGEYLLSGIQFTQNGGTGDLIEFMDEKSVKCNGEIHEYNISGEEITIAEDSYLFHNNILLKVEDSNYEVSGTDFRSADYWNSYYEYISLSFTNGWSYIDSSVVNYYNSSVENVDTDELTNLSGLVYSNYSTEYGSSTIYL